MRSDMAVAVRGAQGVLIAASAGGGVAGQQLERAELTRIVTGLQKLAVLDIISTTDWINLSARQGIRIQGGGSELVLSAAGIEGYTAGALVMHASEHQFQGACGKQAKFPGATVCPTQTAAAAQAGSAAVGVKP